jgi:hypothetical protein
VFNSILEKPGSLMYALASTVATQDFFEEGFRPRIFFQGGSTNSVEDRGQRERGSGGVSPLVRGSAQFANE